jgi:hypothetical protein
VEFIDKTNYVSIEASSLFGRVEHLTLEVSNSCSFMGKLGAF